MLSTGTSAPDFTITLEAGGEFHLADHRGKRHVVLYFFPKAFTKGWILEARGFRDSHEAITEKDAVVLGVSTDSPDTLRRFSEVNALPFPLGSDADRAVTKLYDVRRRLGLGTSRITYVIDKRGIIRFAGHNEVSMGAHIRDALRVLDELEAEAPA